MFRDRGCRSQSGIRGDYRGTELGRELDVDGIDQPQVVTQLPRACEQWSEKVTFNGSVGQTLNPHCDLAGGEVRAAVEAP